MKLFRKKFRLNNSSIIIINNLPWKGKDATKNYS